MIAHDQGGPGIELERSLPSQVAAISPFVDKLMLLIRNAAVFLRASAMLRLHCARPSQTRSFTEIMRIPENTSTFVAAVNLMKSQSR